MGDNWREPTAKYTNTRRKNTKGVNSFVLICVWLLLLGFGLVSLYSASIPSAINDGFPHYYYLLRQALYAVGGIVLAVIVCIIPDKVLQIISWPIFLLSSVSLFFHLNTEPICFISTLMVLSSYYGKRKESCKNFSKNIVPAIVVLISVFILLINMKYFSAFLIYIASLVLISYAGGSIIYFLVFSIFLVTPVFLWIFTNPERIRQFLSCFVPNAATLSYADIYDALKSGGIFGIGLGNGTYKELLPEIKDHFILVNVGEETGFIGILFVIVLFVFVLFLGIQSASKVRENRSFASNLALGSTILLILESISSLCGLCGFVFQPEIILPLFSYGSIGMIISMVEFGFIYRVSRTIDFEGENNINRMNRNSIQDDYVFPEVNGT